jgi:mono/diheme cytochrome c family protein
MFQLSRNLILVLALVGCGQSFNSNTNDYNLIASSYCADQSNTALCDANAIIQQNCANCHFHSGWAAYDTDEEWINSGNGRVVAGDADGSTLITKLRNYGGNMPEGAPQISNEDAETLRDWINGL